MRADKFTGLAANLTTEKDMRVQQNLTTHTEKAAAYTAWIDSESAYREALNKKETAESAVEYAQGQFDKVHLCLPRCVGVAAWVSIALGVETGDAVTPSCLLSLIASGATRCAHWRLFGEID